MQHLYQCEQLIEGFRSEFDSTLHTKTFMLHRPLKLPFNCNYSDFNYELCTSTIDYCNRKDQIVALKAFKRLKLKDCVAQTVFT